MTLAKTRSVADEYLRLIQAFPLRPIRGEREHADAQGVLDKLVVLTDPTPAQQDYLEALTTLVAAYEAKHHHIDLTSVTPLKILKSLMREHAMKPADLGRLLGSSGVASDILNGKRQLSKSHARKLAERFKMNAGAFV